MEETAQAIVAALAADGRMSYTDLAEKVGLSVSAVHQRVRRLAHPAAQAVRLQDGGQPAANDPDDEQSDVAA